ncbi:hypothetical protein NXH76_19045 [Blautia schinkii]|nr:hypothetical protein [Blautia schinkii]
MDVSQFQEKLSGICALAAENDKTLTTAQVREYFDGMDLDKSQLLKVLQYLKVQGIGIEGIDAPEGGVVSAQNKDDTPEAEAVPLTPEEEAYLREYKSGMSDGNTKGGRTVDELFRDLSRGEQSAREVLARLYLPVAADLAVQMNCRELHLADLIQEANVSLLTALGRKLPAGQSAGSNQDEPVEKDDAWLRGEIRGGIRRAIEEQGQRKFEDDCLVAKVQTLEAAIKELTEDDEEGETKLSVEELAIILEMDEEEIRGVLRLTGDDK